MARKTKRPTRRKPAQKRSLRARLLGLVGRLVRRLALAGAVFVTVLAAFFAVFNPVVTPYMVFERARLGGIERGWIEVDDMAPVMLRSVVAAEDANFCKHWGFDMTAIRAALAEGAGRGASTLTQQTVKNVYLWHGRSWVRKALEAVFTPLVELFWSKRRILEVYLNVAEFDEGVFGLEAAADHYFGVASKDLSANQAARLAAVLPNPKGRSAASPSAATSARARAIADGAATIRHDGRAGCFER